MTGNLAALMAGYIFAWGLGLSGMTRPSKVLGFLDVTAAWDPSLAFVMAGAVATAAVMYRLGRKRATPIAAAAFDIPSDRRIDARLIIGAAVFGIGWGLAGYCPGPAVVTMTSGNPGALVFVVAMGAGMLLQRLIPAASRA